MPDKKKTKERLRDMEMPFPGDPASSEPEEDTGDVDLDEALAVPMASAYKREMSKKPKRSRTA